MNHKETAHQWMTQFLGPRSTVIDMTCGNGNDTYFLASHAYHVYAVDIQAQAIAETKNRNQEHTNITYIHADHSLLDYSKKAPYTGAIYNLGYLPRSNKEIITTASTTYESLQRLLPHLTTFLVISCYRGHEGGLEEFETVTDFVMALDANVEILSYETPLSPVTYLIRFK